MGLKIESLRVAIENKQILKDVNLEINNGEFISLLGKSGCGKSTLLKAITGLLEYQEGHIYIDGDCIDSIPPHLRNIVLVFQDLRLFPNMLTWENVAFPLKMKGTKKNIRKETAYQFLEKVGLSGLENRKINQLSGGQQQRVALARAFAAKPRILLLDEPFSGLDEELRDDMHRLLLKLQKEFKMTVILVTHDKTEAMKLSDRVTVMVDGTI